MIEAGQVHFQRLDIEDIQFVVNVFFRRFGILIHSQEKHDVDTFDDDEKMLQVGLTL